MKLLITLFTWVAGTIWSTYAIAAISALEVQWRLETQQGRPTLVGFSGEYEGDNVFSARCRRDGLIDLSVGAHQEIGTGNGERVRLRLESGDRVVTLVGVSRRSPDFEMTNGTELRAVTNSNDLLFDLLASGSPIAVTGSTSNPLIWNVRGLKRKVATFLARCAN